MDEWNESVSQTLSCCVMNEFHSGIKGLRSHEHRNDTEFMDVNENQKLFRSENEKNNESVHSGSGY